MSGETNLSALIKGMTPQLNTGEYVFAIVQDLNRKTFDDGICMFKEKEGITVVMEQKKADALKLNYAFVASWITLTIHSSLDAVGLTAVFSTELAKHQISCNVIAGYYHDHIFVDKKDTEKAMSVLHTLSNNYE